MMHSAKHASPARKMYVMSPSLPQPLSHIDGAEGLREGRRETCIISCIQMLAFDGEGRAILTEHKCGSADKEGEMVDGGGREWIHLVVINVYCPMVDRENVKADRLDYKLLFYSVLQDRCTALEQAGK